MPVALAARWFRRTTAHDWAATAHDWAPAAQVVVMFVVSSLKSQDRIFAKFPRAPGRDTHFFCFRFRAFSASMRLKASMTLGGQRKVGALAGS